MSLTPLADKAPVNVSNLIVGIPIAVALSTAIAISWNSYKVGAWQAQMESTVASNTQRLDHWRSRIEADHDLLARVDERSRAMAEDIAEIKRLLQERGR